MGFYQVKYLGGHPAISGTGDISVTIDKRKRLLKLQKGIFNKKQVINGIEIMSVRVDEKHHRSLGKGAAGAIIGGVLTGGIGVVAGGAIGGRRREGSNVYISINKGGRVYEIVLKAGKKAYKIYSDVNTIITTSIESTPPQIERIKELGNEKIIITEPKTNQDNQPQDQETMEIPKDTLLKKEWYDKKGLVFLLLVIFFPIGLYALWKSSSISKGLKIGLTATVFLFVIIIGSSDKNRQKENSPTKTVTQTEENNSKVTTVTKEITFQEYFLQQKAGFYNNDYINAKNDAVKRLFKNKTEKLTKQLLDSVNYNLINWVGTISKVWLAYGHNQRDMELLRTMSPNDLIEKYPEGRDLNISINIGEKKLAQATYLASVTQEFSPKQNKRGVKPNSPLYETVLGFKEGQQVVFSAKVKRTYELYGDNEQFTGFNIELTYIKSIE